MKGRFHVLSVLLAVLPAVSCCSGSSTEPPESAPIENDTKERMYKFVPDFQREYILGLQVASGAIPDNGSSNSKITPYFADFAAMALLTDPSEANLKAVKAWISWSLAHLNGDKNPVTGAGETPGSIYDYFLPGETTNGTYDSSDSYASVFLDLVKRYAEISDDNLKWAQSNKEKLSLVAECLVSLIDPKDGLTNGSRSYAIKQLMDNCETYAGLVAADWLQKHGILETGHNFAALAEANAKGIEGMWNGSEYLSYSSRTSAMNWKTFYPDATCEIFPAIYGVLPPRDNRAKALYKTFNSNYPNWSKGTYYGDFPWTLISRAAAVMGDEKRMDEYVEFIYNLNVKGEQGNRWYSAEAGHLVLAIDIIKK